MAASITDFTRHALLAPTANAVQMLKNDFAGNIQLDFCVALLQGKPVPEALDLAPWKSRIRQHVGDLRYCDQRIVGLMKQILGHFVVRLITTILSEERLESLSRYYLSFGGRFTEDLLNRDKNMRIALAAVAQVTLEETLAELQVAHPAIDVHAPKIAGNGFKLNTIDPAEEPIERVDELFNMQKGIHIGHYRGNFGYPMGTPDLIIRLSPNWNYLPEDLQNLLAKEDVQDFELLVQRHDMRWPCNAENPLQNLNIVPHPWLFHDCQHLDDVRRFAKIGMFHMDHVTTTTPMRNQLQPLRPRLHPKGNPPGAAFSGNIAKFKMQGDEASFVSVVIHQRNAIITYHSLVKRGAHDLNGLNTLNDLPAGWHGPFNV